MGETTGQAVWLNLTAALDELGTIVAVRLPPAAPVARDAHARAALSPPALQALDAAGAALNSARVAAATLQIHRWPAAATWRAAFTSAT